MGLGEEDEDGDQNCFCYTNRERNQQILKISMKVDKKDFPNEKTSQN